MYDVVIIGAGVVGAFVARQLSRYKLKIALLEKNWDICCESTKANTAIVHSGYSGKPGSLKAAMTVAANEDFEHVCDELDVEFVRTGSLLIALDEIGLQKIQEKYKRGLANGVKGMELLSGTRVLELQPNLNPGVIGALYAPSTGVVNPWEFGLAAAENAVENGVELFLDTKVVQIRRVGEFFVVKTNKQVFEARYVVNCAGLYSDEINNMVARPFFRIAPRRGEYYVLDTEAAAVSRYVIFQARGNDEVKGVVIAPTVHGNILVGPSTEDLEVKDDVRTTAEKLATIKQIAEKSIRGIPYNLVIRKFAGIRPRPQLARFDVVSGEVEFYEDDVKDFILGEPAGCENFINCAGIKSPGLTCANEIGKYVARLIQAKEGERLKLNTAFNPRRRRVIRFHKLSLLEQQKIVRENPLYGNIVCRCRQITEGEIVDAIHRRAGAFTVDGVKRRAGAGLGRCQGGVCTPAIIKILARELGIEPERVRKDAPGSEILSGRMDQGVTWC